MMTSSNGNICALLALCAGTGHVYLCVYISISPFAPISSSIIISIYPFANARRHDVLFHTQIFIHQCNVWASLWGMTYAYNKSKPWNIATSAMEAFTDILPLMDSLLWHVGDTIQLVPIRYDGWVTVVTAGDSSVWQKRHLIHVLMYPPYTSQWRNNGFAGFSNHQPHDYLLNRLFMSRSKKTSKLRVTGLCVGNSPVTGEFPAQRSSNAFDDVIVKNVYLPAFHISDR